MSDETTKKKRYKLRNLEIDRVDHVDRGANQHADIVFFKNSPDLSEVHQTSVPPKKKRKKTPTEELAAMNDLIAKAAAKAAEKKKKPPWMEEDEESQAPSGPEDKTAPKPAPKFPPGQDPKTLPGAEKKPPSGGLPGSPQQKPVQRPDGVTAPAPNPFAQKPKPPAAGALGQPPAQAGLPGRPAGMPGMPPPGADKTSRLAQMAEQKAGAPGGLGAGGLKPPVSGSLGVGKPSMGGPPGAEPPLSVESAAGGKVFNFYFSAEQIEKRVDDVLDTVVDGLIDSGVFIETATGEDLRDMLPEDVITSLRKAVSAKSADTTPKEAGMAQDENLPVEVPDETVEYIKQLEGQVTELSKALEDFVYADEDPEKIEFDKALAELPPEVAEKVRADAERLAEIEKKAAEDAQAQADAVYIEKVRSFDGVVEAPEVFGRQLREVAEISPELAEAIEKALSTASGRIMTGDLFKEAGHSLPGDNSGAWEKATTIAKSMVEAGTSPSVEVARATVWEQNPDLYDEYQTERRG
jgi:hypothetical protein